MSDENKVLLRVSNLKQYFPIGKKKMGKPQSFVKANDGISLNIYEGETFGLENPHSDVRCYSFTVRPADAPYITDVPLKILI